MCGRYVAKWSKEVFQETFNVQPPLFESYNIAPTQYAPIIWQPAGARETLDARWGLMPRWVKKPADFKASMFNARAETLADKASFRRPFKSQRCLVPASGFYEWKKVGGSKQPHYIHGDKPLAFAGLYDYWSGKGEKGETKELYSYSIITTSPNELMRDIHNRMPVILDEQYFDDWLDPDNKDTEMLEHLLQPYAGTLEAYPVDRRVGRVRENDADLIQPTEEGCS